MLDNSRSVTPYLESNECQLIATVFGLIGVVLGGLITAGSSYLLESWREKRARAFKLKRAARLMESNLINVWEFFCTLTWSSRARSCVRKRRTHVTRWLRYWARTVRPAIADPLGHLAFVENSRNTVNGVRSSL